jgi:DNA-binding MarR family transcriptional regulator
MEPQAGEAPPVLALARLGAVMRRAFSVRMASEHWAAEAGMRPGCYSVLRAVAAASEPPSQRALSDRLGIDPSDLVGLLDVLEQADYLARQRDPRDRRRHALSATDQGRAALLRFDRVAEQVADDVLGVIDPRRRAELEALLLEVVEAHEPDRAG